MEPAPGDVTRLLHEWKDGNREALDDLVPLLYGELRRLSRQLLRKGGPQSMQTNSLINEAFLRLVDQTNIDWESRNHFLGIAARTMRNVLVDEARRARAQKRGGGKDALPFDEELFTVERERGWDVIALDDALKGLSEMDPDLGHLVDLRYFGGLTVGEIAEGLGVSEATVKRSWQTAKHWLHRELDRRA